MDRQEAITMFKGIQNGYGVDMTKFPDVFKGSVAMEFWDKNAVFTLGVEYGVLIALHEIYGITLNDLAENKNI
jgi:hypothetical protein